MKFLFFCSLLFLNITSFSQEKLIERVTINTSDFKVIETISNSNDAIKVYEVQKLINDTVVSKIEIIKSYKNDLEDYTSTYKLIDSVFTFHVTLKKGEQTLYGINRVFISPKGYIFKGLEYDELTDKQPEENTYPAQFEGGLISLRKWIQNYLDAQRMLRISGKEHLRLSVNIDIDKTGKAILNSVTGSELPQIKIEMERLIKRMPKWIPAKEKNETVVSKFNIPIDLISAN